LERRRLSPEGVNCVSSWKSNCLGRLADEIAFNRRFSDQAQESGMRKIVAAR
jgi:hypothetical protein